MLKKLQNNPFYLINILSKRVGHLESQIVKLQEELDKQVQVHRSQLIRLKNQENLSDQHILNGNVYYDLSPEQASELYHDPDFDFILLDVSEVNYQPQFHFENAMRIPLEDLAFRHQEIQNKKTPILIISENGLRSILACELLAKLGYFNTNNISGGHQYWKGMVEKKSA